MTPSPDDAAVPTGDPVGVPIDHALEHAIEKALDCLRMVDRDSRHPPLHVMHKLTGWNDDELCDAYQVIHGLPAELTRLRAEKAELVEALNRGEAICGTVVYNGNQRSLSHDAHMQCWRSVGDGLRAALAKARSE